MKTLIKFTTVLFLMFGTNTYSQSEFPLFKSAKTPDVGLSPENPVIINTPFKQRTLKKTAYFLKGLRTQSGEKLEVIEVTEIPNPNFKKPAILLHNFITGEVINKGNGKFIKKVTLKAQGSCEIYELYVNNHVKEDLLVPQIFVFEIPENLITSN